MREYIADINFTLLGYRICYMFTKQDKKAVSTHIKLPQDVAKQESKMRPIEKLEEILCSQPNKSCIEKVSYNAL